ncbi:MAG: hypothetical protein ACOC3V_01990 [bacterium]
MKTKFSDFLFENTTPNISIDDDIDERSPKSKKIYDVNYQLETDEGLVEIEGVIISTDTGRINGYSFEPSYFTDDYSEEYWDENWEDVERQILDYFTSNY